MTRPAGTTPRGLPYPGSAGVVAETSKALQSLAEAITAQLGSLGAGVIIDTFSGKVRTGAAGSWRASQFTVPFVNLSVVYGAVAMLGTFAGGANKAGWITPPAAGSNLFTVVSVTNSVAPYDGFENSDISVCALGWGLPL